MQILLKTNQIMNLTKNIGTTVGKAGGDSLQLLLLLIDKHNALDASDTLPVSGLFYYTKAEAEKSANLLRKRYDSAVKALVAAKLINDYNKDVANKQYKYKHFRLNIKNIMALTKSTDNSSSQDNDSSNSNDKKNIKNNSEPKEHSEKKEAVHNGHINRTISKTNSVVNEDDIHTLITLSDKRLNRTQCQFLIKTYGVQLAKEKLCIAKKQYGTLDNIKNLTGFIRSAITNNYSYSCQSRTDINDKSDNIFANDNNINTVANAMGYSTLTPQLRSKVAKWLHKASIEVVVKAIMKTIEMIKNPHPGYIEKVLDKMLAGTYRDTISSNNNKTKPNFYQDYTQRDYSEEEYKELELRLLGLA